MSTWFKIVAWVVAIAGAVGLVLHLYFLEVWRIPTDDPLLAASIEPTLSAGDIIVMTRRRSIDRGNLVRCSDPQAPGRFVIARAMGRFGDRVDLKDEVVMIDGKHTPSPRACDPPSMTLHDPRTDEDVSLTCSVEEYGDMPFSSLRAAHRTEATTRATVEAGRWFLVSDDRHVHLDSRDYGQIDPGTCEHVVFRLVGAAGFDDSRRRLNIIW
jgi:signal peptidase I